MFSVCNDKRIFTFYVTSDGALHKAHCTDMSENEEIKANNPRHIGSWHITDAHNWGVSVMARKWKYETVHPSARFWHKRITECRAKIAEYKALKSNPIDR